jgi:hypothetical protein
MEGTTIEELRLPHPDQDRIDESAAHTLRATGAALLRRREGFFHPRRGLAPAVRNIPQAEAPARDPSN